MNHIKNIPGWIFVILALTAAAIFMRFAMRGYNYLAYTLLFIAGLILIRHIVGDGLWRVCVILVSLGLIYFMAIEIPIIKNSWTDPEPERKYLVVLGAAVIGDHPSISLQRRLSAAADYLEEYPDSIAIVSGGQGEGEDITEAQCMQDWLLSLGIDNERIIQEPLATSTMENLSFSFDIIRDRGDDPDGNVAIVSSSYHLYRAKSMARMLGAEAAGITSPMGYPLSMLSSYIREAFGVTHLWVFGN